MSSKFRSEIDLDNSAYVEATKKNAGSTGLFVASGTATLAGTVWEVFKGNEKAAIILFGIGAVATSAMGVIVGRNIERDINQLEEKQDQPQV